MRPGPSYSEVQKEIQARQLTDASVMLSHVQHVATTATTLVGPPCVLAATVLALAEEPLFAFINICKCQAREILCIRNYLRSSNSSAFEPLF